MGFYRKSAETSFINLLISIHSLGNLRICLSWTVSPTYPEKYQVLGPYQLMFMNVQISHYHSCVYISFCMGILERDKDQVRILRGISSPWETKEYIPRVQVSTWNLWNNYM